MASAYAQFWQTLITTSTELSATLTGQNSLLAAIYHDVNPDQATALGKVINILIPNNMEADVQDTPYGNQVFDEYGSTTVPLDFNKNPSKGVIIRDFEQYNSPTSIRDVLMTPMLQAVIAKANGYIAALLNTTNFNRTTAVATTGSAVTTTQFLQAQEQLINQGVVVQDPNRMSYIQATPVWTRQQGDDNWTKESTVGVGQAVAARVEGGLKVAFGARVAVDRQMPRTGSAGSYVYTSVYMSRTCIAAGFRPLPKGGPGVETVYIPILGIPVRVMLSYDHDAKAYKISADIGMGLAVVRPEQGVLFTTAQ